LVSWSHSRESNSHRVLTKDLCYHYHQSGKWRVQPVSIRHFVLDRHVCRAATLWTQNGARGESRTRKTFRPGVFLTTSAFAAIDNSWSGLCLHHSLRLRCSPSSLYTFPLGLGSALARFRRAFAEFGEFYIQSFPWCTQCLRPLRMPFRHTSI